MSKMYDWKGAADYLGVDERFIKRLWQERRLGGVKDARYVRFREQDLDDYIERHRVQAIND